MDMPARQHTMALLFVSRVLHGDIRDNTSALAFEILYQKSIGHLGKRKETQRHAKSSSADKVWQSPNAPYLSPSLRPHLGHINLVATQILS